MVFEINPDTDVLFLQRQTGYTSSRAHNAFITSYQRVTTRCLVEKTNEMNDGTYYTLRKGVDKDNLVNEVLTELDNEIDGNVRFLWKRGDDIVVLDRNDPDDNKLIGDRIWKRMTAHRGSWVKNQENQKAIDILMRMKLQAHLNQK